MSRNQPRTPEWAAYFRAHPDVISTWGEANGRSPSCRCDRCAAERGQVVCGGSGERWEAGVPGAPRCPGCGQRAVLLGCIPGRARAGGGFLGHVPTHWATSGTVQPKAMTPQYGVHDVRPSSDYL